MPSVARRALRPVFVAAAIAGIAACSEKLDGGAGCPILCPDQTSELRDTTVDAIALDTTVAPFPAIGTEQFLYISTRGPAGDTLQTFGVVRFDTLPNTYKLPNDTTTQHVTTLDSAYLLIRVVTDTGQASVDRIPLRVSFDLYDVDTTAADTNFAAVATLFRSDRRIGGRENVSSAELRGDSLFGDTIKIPLDTAVVRAHVQAGTRLRVGIRARATTSVALRLGTSEGALATRLRYDPSPDTAVHAITVGPASRTPSDQPVLEQHLADYTVVRLGSPPVQAGLLSVGGIPGRRTYVRFSVPRRLLDSTTVVKATLILTQRPLRSVDQRDSLTVFPQFVLAGARVTNIAAAARILAPATALPAPAIRVAPIDSGERRFDIVTFVRQWRSRDTTEIPQALVLRSASEGTLPLEALFFSSEADEGLRPRLRITYAPRTPLGVP